MVNSIFVFNYHMQYHNNKHNQGIYIIVIRHDLLDVCFRFMVLSECIQNLQSFSHILQSTYL
jgi:hypothetical protein